MPVRSLLTLVIVVGFSLRAAAVVAQAPGGTVQRGGSYERISGRNNPALTYFGGSAAMAYASRPAATPLPAPLPVRTAPISKPFSGGVHQGSNLSPYLGLDGRESETGLPNYFLYVKPQLDQQRVNHVQQAQYRKLQQQVRTASAPGVVTSPGGGIPTTGHSAQFMNGGGYYPTLTR